VWQSDSNQGMKYRVMSKTEQQELMEDIPKRPKNTLMKLLIPLRMQINRKQSQKKSMMSNVIANQFLQASLYPQQMFSSKTCLIFFDGSDSDASLDAPSSIDEMDEEELERWTKEMEQLYSEEVEE